MGYAKINGLDILGAKIAFSRHGVWTADVVVNADTAAQLAEGATGTITYGKALTFVGTIHRSAAFANEAALRMVGGTNRLGTLCRPRFYKGVAIALVLQDILGDAGETLSATSPAAATSIVLPFWTVIAQPVGLSLTMLTRVAPVGCVWRVLPDGSVYFGVDGFVPAATFEYDLLEYSTEHGYQILGAEEPTVSPGQSFNGQHVSLVEYQLEPEKSRVKIWFEAP